jgi:adenosylcobinamide-GDP ribazoletransferase
MKDPHVGSFGTLALVLAILGKYAALSELEGPARSWALFGAIVVARTLVLVSAGMAGYARPEGTGRILIEATTLHDALGASVLILVVGLAVAGRSGLLVAGLALAVGWVLTRFAVARLGGVTGDTLGAVVEVGEVAFLAGMATFGHHS